MMAPGKCPNLNRRTSTYFMDRIFIPSRPRGVTAASGGSLGSHAFLHGVEFSEGLYAHTTSSAMELNSHLRLPECRRRELAIHVYQEIVAWVD
jgi:hypothetical protein